MDFRSVRESMEAGTARLRVDRERRLVVGRPIRPSTRVSRALAQGTIRCAARNAACHERAAERGESNGGGAGIRTRVRKYILAGIYDAYPLLKSRP